MPSRRIAWMAFVLLAGCVAPPRDAFVPSQGKELSLGQDTTHHDCVQRSTQDGGVLVYCGDARRPSAEVTPGKASLTPMQLAQASTWRSGLNDRFTCQAPVQATVFDAPAAELECQYNLNENLRVSGEFSHVALVTQIDGMDYFGDADPSAFAVLQRAIGVMSHKVPPQKAATLPADPGTEAFRTANQAANSHDIHAYDSLMETGIRANLSDHYAAAEAAFRQAAALQAPGTPAFIDASVHRALQLSNLGRYVESDAIFRSAASEIAALQSPRRGSLIDPTIAPRLALYRGLNLLNQNRPTQAMPFLRTAEQEFIAAIPSDVLAPEPVPAVASSNGLEATIANLPDEQLFEQPAQAAALLGLITTYRAQAVAELMLKNLTLSATDAAEAEALAQQHGLAKAILEARILRTTAMIDNAQGQPVASLALLTRSVGDFQDVFPDSLPLAETMLLRAAALLSQRQTADGEQACRNAIDMLSRLQVGGIGPDLIMPCLDALAAGSPGRTEQQAQDAYAEMFIGAQLAQSTLTSAQIAELAARLAELQRNTPVGEAIRVRDIDKDNLDRLLEQRAELDQARASGQKPSADVVNGLNTQIAHAQTAYNNADAALHAAAPNYGQLVQETVTAKQVFAAPLRPDEALAEIVLGANHGWTLLLRNGRIAIGRIDRGAPAMQTLVHQIRSSMSPLKGQYPPAFDTAAAKTVYDATLRGTASLLQGTKALIVVPSGPLLSIPFGLLLTGPAGNDLSQAPWLIQQMTIAHVPAPENFVSLRKLASGKHAPDPWIGFGDPLPVTKIQAIASFPATACANTARILDSLPRLDGARDELQGVGALFGVTGQGDEFLGARFTTQAVLGADLKDYRVVHFATHGFLPSDLACQSEPALLTSQPPGAKTAQGALLGASQIAALTLNADVVILSACNSGGPEGDGGKGGPTSGESLSGLARSFFYAGARAVLATHWSVNDPVTTVLVKGTMQRYHDDPAMGLANALALEQRDLLRQASGPGLSVLAHPFYWAPLALIGEGGGTMPAKTVASRTTAPRL